MARKYVNRGIRQYTDAEKRQYYARRKSVGRARMYGQGAYKVGRPYIRGRGAYSVPRNFFNAKNVGGSVLGTLGGVAGSALGSAIAPGIGTALGGTAGASIGKALGELGGSVFKQLTGWGDYTLRENSLVYPDRVVPSFGEDSIRVKKREYICDINASTAFANNSFPVNPGLSEVFPWLSAIANNYEQYRWNGLVYQYVSTSSDAIASSTNLGMGQLCIASDYNAGDEAYRNLPQALSSMFANSGKPSENIMHAVECAPTDVPNKLFYCRSGDVPSGQDIRLYDMLSLQVMTQKMPAAYTGMGQLWVSYDITFCKSIQNNQLGFDINTDKYIMVAPSQTSSKYFGTSRTLVDRSNLGTTVTDNKISFPPDLSSGYYLIHYSTTGASTACVSPTGTNVNCTSLQVWTNNTATAVSNTGSTVTTFILSEIVRLDDRDATITFSAGTLPASPTYGDLIITQINCEMFD